MPVILNEPVTLLQKMSEGIERGHPLHAELEYSYLLDQANSEKDPIRRMRLVAAFAVSGYASTKTRASRKPFNPLIGETFELGISSDLIKAVRKDLGFRFVAEKVAHRPHTIIAGHGESINWIFHQENKITTKFWGKSVELTPSGNVHVILKCTGEHFTWQKITSRFASMHNSCKSISGMVERVISHHGDMVIKNQTTGSCITLCFRESGFFGPVSTIVNTSSFRDGEGRKIEQGGIEGNWDGKMSVGDEILWTASKVDTDGFYGFGEFAMHLNELSLDISEVIPKSDSRLRKDMRVYEQGDVILADELKLKLEARQREAIKSRKAFVPRWFSREEGEWRFTGEYWHAKDTGFKRMRGNIPDLS